MIGKNHVTVNACVFSGLTCAVCSDICDIIWVQTIQYHVLNWLWPSKMMISFKNGSEYESVIYMVIGLFMFWLGSLLPDIDNPTSTLGRFVRLPGLEHRTWTHSMWMVAINIGLCFLHPQFHLLTLGVILHIWMDVYSASGVCFTYPFKKYRKYSGGAFVAPGHRIKLYYVGKRSERVFAIICCMIALLICVFAVLYGHAFQNFLKWIWY